MDAIFKKLNLKNQKAVVVILVSFPVACRSIVRITHSSVSKLLKEKLLMPLAFVIGMERMFLLRSEIQESSRYVFCRSNDRQMRI